MIVGYIRVSTNKQDLKNQKNIILDFANQKKMIIDKFIESNFSSRKSKKERKIDEVFSILRKEDSLIITELSRLGRSVQEVLDIVNQLIDKGVYLFCIKENICLKDQHSIQSKVMITMFSLFAELERDMVSQRTKEALALKKAQGVKLGRPKGYSKSKLDPMKDQIQGLLDKDISKMSISKLLNVSYPTLFDYIKKHNMLKGSEKEKKKYLKKLR